HQFMCRARQYRFLHPISSSFLVIVTRPPPGSTLFPYTTLFRSGVSSSRTVSSCTVEGAGNRSFESFKDSWKYAACQNYDRCEGRLHYDETVRVLPTCILRYYRTPTAST